MESFWRRFCFGGVLMCTGVELKLLGYVLEHAKYSRIRVWIRHVNDDSMRNCHLLDRTFRDCCHSIHRSGVPIPRC